MSISTDCVKIPKDTLALIRASKALSTLDPCQRQFDKDNDISPPSGRHSHVSIDACRPRPDFSDRNFVLIYHYNSYNKHVDNE